MAALVAKLFLKGESRVGEGLRFGIFCSGFLPEFDHPFLSPWPASGDFAGLFIMGDEDPIFADGKAALSSLADAFEFPIEILTPIPPAGIRRTRMSSRYPFADCVKRILFASAIIVAISSGISLKAQKSSDFRFPPVEELPSNAMMPDPFLRPDGTRVASHDAWPSQRAHLRATLEHYLYGTVPPKPT